MKLNGVMIGSENPTILGDFYTKVAGEPGWHDGEWYGFDISGGMLMIGPHSEVKGKSQTPARIIIAFQTDTVQADFDKIMSVDGATVVAEPYQPSKEDKPQIWLATLSDPDGNYIQLATPWEG